MSRRRGANEKYKRTTFDCKERSAGDAVIAVGGGVGICPSYFGLENTCNKNILCDCDVCWHFALSGSEKPK